MTKLLSKQDVISVLDMNDTINILETAFKDLSNGDAILPQRTPITAPEHNGLSLFMPAYLKGIGALGTKVVTVYKDNPAKHDLPTIMGTITILDDKTGSPKAIMDGGFLTAMRTGGIAGLASKLLSKEDSKVHTLFGSGGMALTHAWAIDCVRNIERLNIVSLDPPEKKEEFVVSLKQKVDCEIKIAENAEEVVRQSDIVTLITSAKDPIINGDWIQHGTHINGVGSHAPTTREIDTKTVLKSKVFCDLIEACKPEAGDFIIPIENGEWSWSDAHGSLGDVITGKIPGRKNNEEITLFKSVGLAIQDISTALHVYNKAVDMNVGKDFSFT